MTTLNRIILLAVAVVVVVLAVVFIPGSDSTDKGASTTPPATGLSQDVTTGATDGSGGVTAPDDTATATTPAPAAEPAPPLLRSGKVTPIEVKKGETVRFRVSNPTAEEVHIHGYDIAKDLPAGKTITVSFKATIEGIFEIELEHSGEQIAKLTVEPS